MTYLSKKNKKILNTSLKTRDLPIFGMIKYEKKSVEEIMAELRGPRYRWQTK